jgi:hypothetical protein
MWKGESEIQVGCFVCAALMPVLAAMVFPIWYRSRVLGLLVVAGIVLACAGLWLVFGALSGRRRNGK